MSRRELKGRGKGLLVLMLAFLMMLGTNMTVLAADTYVLDGGANPPSLKEGDKLQGGATIRCETWGAVWWS